MKPKKKPKLENIKKWVKLRIKDLEIYDPEKILKNIIQDRPEIKEDDVTIGRVLAIAKNLLKEKPTTEGKERQNFLERNFYETQKIIAEEIFNDEENFMVYNKETKHTTILPSITTDDEIMIIPMNAEIIEKGAVLLPTGIEQYENIESLIEELRQHIIKYTDVEEKFLKFSIYYILLSWVSDKLNTIPYLRVLGDTGVGKSRFLDVVGRLCYKAIIISGAVTPAPVYRIIEKWRGTLIIDEADRKQSDTTDEIIKILNCGFERGRPVIRCNKENPDDIQVHDVFGPKVLSTRYRFYDKALESRCITTVMKETDREDIPPMLPPSYYEEEKLLRNKLLMFRFNAREKISLDVLEKLSDLGMETIEPRLKQTAAPFFVLLVDDEIKTEFKKFITDYSREIVEERADTLEGIIVNTINDLRGEVGEVSAKDVKNKINLNKREDEQVSTQKIGKRIKSLGLKTVRKRIEGENRRFIDFDEKLWENLVKRYVPCEPSVPNVPCTPLERTVKINKYVKGDENDAKNKNVPS